jgi:uncharacterized zinc-type alcohol dehydrogenase-like protein
VKSQGYAALNENGKIEPYAFERREVGANDVALDILYGGICHSDIHQVRGEWGPALFPMVPGHEIVGRVTSIGGSVSKFAVGDLIGIGVFIDSCRTCKNCLVGLQQYCLNGMTGTYNGYERDGTTVAMGGYSNNFVINEDYAVHVPANLPLEGVAPLMCAGITLYSPLKHWNAGPGKKVAIMGLGGLGHMGLKFAAALGAHVTVLSHSPTKRGDALAMGAHDFVVMDSDEAFESLKKNFDLILNTVSADMPIAKYLDLVAVDGALVMIGLPNEPLTVSVGSLIGSRRTLSGSMIGGIPELQEMLEFCGIHNIVSEVEVIKPEYINEAYDRTVASDVKYRFVIDSSAY